MVIFKYIFMSHVCSDVERFAPHLKICTSLLWHSCATYWLYARPMSEVVLCSILMMLWFLGADVGEFTADGCVEVCGCSEAQQAYLLQVHTQSLRTQSTVHKNKWYRYHNVQNFEHAIPTHSSFKYSQRHWNWPAKTKLLNPDLIDLAFSLINWLIWNFQSIFYCIFQVLKKISFSSFTYKKLSSNCFKNVWRFLQGILLPRYKLNKQDANYFDIFCISCKPFG